jgi:L-amino acid N-acyltransferase
MRLVNCTYAAHGQAVLEIFNEAILNSTALYDYQPRTMENMVSWFEIKAIGDFPVIGIENNSGELWGFASYGTFRNWPAYKYSIEHSIYIHHQQRGQGLGRQLLQELIAIATDRQYHNMIGGIDLNNIASIALHEKLGFRHCGTVAQAGFKFDRWLDLGFYQLLLPSPLHPVDG